MSKLAVIATIPVKPGAKEQAVELLKGAIANTRTEDGTLTYILHEDPKSPDTLVMYELYSGQGALDAHMSADWFKALGPALMGVLGGAPTLQVLTPLDGKGL